MFSKKEYLFQKNILKEFKWVGNLDNTILNPEINRKNAQLLITSHDTYILDTCELKREQIWFTDKNKDCGDT